MVPPRRPLLFGDRSAHALDTRFRELLAKLKTNRPGDSPDLVRRAYEFAAEQHAAQKRQSGEPFLSHPLEVAHILADMKLDTTTLAAALLHDVVEDTKIPIEQIADTFGPDVARLVSGATKISRLEFLSPESRQAENVRKMLLAMVDDVRVVVVKLADRLHNMRTLQFLPEDRRHSIARETLEIYAPIANRLGMGLMRRELEDLAFRYLEPESYLELSRRVASKSKSHEKFLAAVKTIIQKKLVENGIPAEVESRVKGLFSLHLKLERGQRSLDQVYDLLAVRVITDTIKNCYATLGVIHQIWKPVPGRFKDYISMPRPNLYQALHTTVLHEGQPLEVQIRTQEMHRVAEQGVAAHWKYKDGRDTAEADDLRILWMRQLIEWVKDMQEPSEFLSTLRVDLYPDEVYTFTPRGRVIPLPRGATPVDFAYAVHTEVGHACVGAKVNGQMVSLRHQLANGDVVEILTQKGHVPSRDWLTFVVTSRARSKIRHWLSVLERRQATDVGRRLLEKEARHFGVSLKRIPEDALQRVASEYGCARVEDLFAQLGYGKYSARQVLSKATGQPLEEKEPPKETGFIPTVRRALGLSDAAAISVRGHDDLMVYRARCCNPIPGDEIIGYITRGRGVAIHNKNCKNVQKLLYDSERRMPVEWTSVSGATFPVQLVVRSEDRPGILAAVTAVISEAKANIRTLATVSQNLQARIEISLEITDRRQLERILANIKKISGVLEVERLFRG
jgi:GTP pyrophosphokinase